MEVVADTVVELLDTLRKVDFSSSRRLDAVGKSQN